MTLTVPHGWAIAQFDEVAEIVTGSTPSTKVREYYDGPVPFVAPADLDRGLPIVQAKSSLSQLGAQQARLVPKGAVLVCCIGATIGKVGIAGTEVATNQQINSLVFDPNKVNSRYGYYYCQTLKEFIRHSGTSTTLPILNKGRFSKIQIPLPPLPEQKRIADILDKADAIRRKRRDAIQNLLSIPRSAFNTMFGTASQNRHRWKIGTIRDLLAEVKYGTSAKASSNGAYPILRMNNITYEGAWDFREIKYIDIPDKDLPKYLVRKGDILFNRTNSKELVGKTAVYQEDTPMAFAGYLVRARTNELAHPEFVAAYLNSPHGKATLRHMCKNIVGMANINAQEFQDIVIPHPPLTRQLEYVTVLQRIREAERGLGSAYSEANTLFHSLVQRAFAGEL